MQEREYQTSATRPAVVLRALVVLALLLLVTPSLACAGQARESTFALEFRRLHGVTDSGMLSVVETAPESIVGTIRRDLPEGFLVVLPGYLPPDFELAAPFRGTGSGSSLPNPHVWADGYAVTFTDGSARLTVVVGAGDELFVGSGEESSATLGDRPLFVLDESGLVQVFTGPDGGTPVVVVGERLESAEVLRVAAGLRQADEPAE